MGRHTCVRWVPGNANTWDPTSPGARCGCTGRRARRPSGTWCPSAATPSWPPPSRPAAPPRPRSSGGVRGTGAPAHNVLLFIGSNRYDVGSFTVQRYETPVLYMVRLRASGTPATTGTTSLLPNPPPPRVSQGDSILEDLYRQLFAAWDISANYNRVMYHLDDDSASTVTWYTPDGYLYDVLSDAALEWCGPANRHGRHCLVEIKPVYPAQDVFSKLRTRAEPASKGSVPDPDADPGHQVQRGGSPGVRATGRGPHGRTHELRQSPSGERPTPRGCPPRPQYSAGCMGILFRPGDGVTRRVHFNVVAERVALLLGEVGEFGPIHATVIGGHQAIAAQGLLPKPQ